MNLSISKRINFKDGYERLFFNSVVPLTHICITRCRT